MEILEQDKHREALIRQRTKFVVEKGATARLFRRETHPALQHELLRWGAARVYARRTREEYDA